MLNTMQTNKCLGIFNRHLIALNIEQMTVITRMSDYREGMYEYGKCTCLCVCFFFFDSFTDKWLNIMLGKKKKGTFNL